MSKDDLAEAVARLAVLCTGSDRSMGVNPAARQIRADIGVVLAALSASTASPHHGSALARDEHEILSAAPARDGDE